MPTPVHAASRPIRIAIIGETRPTPDDSLDRSGALALALRQTAGVDVTLRAIATNTSTCATIGDILNGFGIVSQVTARDDGDPAPIRLGDTLDIWGLFAHDLVILDADDAPLRAFLTDLPAHTAPGVRILGTLDYVNATMSSREREIALRFDTIVGTAAQADALFGLPPDTGAASMAIAQAIGAMMRGTNLRAAAILDDTTLAIASLDEPVATIDLPSGSTNEQIATAVAVAMARRSRWQETADLLPSP